MESTIDLMSQSFEEWLDLGEDLQWLELSKMKIAVPYRVLDVTFNPRYKSDPAKRELWVYVDSSSVSNNHREAFNIRGFHCHYTFFASIRAKLNCGFYITYIILIWRDGQDYQFDFTMKLKSETTRENSTTRL